MAKPKMFQLSTTGRDSHPDMTDVRGKVRVVVRSIASNGKFLKGNVTRTLTFRDARVSEVASAIKERLIGDAQ